MKKYLLTWLLPPLLLSNPNLYPQSTPIPKIYTTHGTFTEKITQIQWDQKLLLTTNQKLQLQHVVKISFPHQPSPWQKLPLLVLQNGDILKGKLLKGGELDLYIEFSHLPKKGILPVPLDYLQGVFLLPHTPTQETALQKIQNILQKPTEEDQIYLLKGGSLPCTIKEIHPKSILYEMKDLGNQTISLQKVQAIRIAPLTNTPPKPPKLPYAKVYLKNGTTLTGTIQAYTPPNLILSHPYLNSITIPLTYIQDIYLFTPAFTHISDMPSPQIQFQPGIVYTSHLKTIQHYLQQISQPKKDRNVHGKFLRIYGKVYPKGLGLRTGTKITYNLQQQYQSLHLSTALDDLTRQPPLTPTNLTLKIYSNGKKIYQSPPLTPSSPLLSITLPLHNTQKLTIEVLSPSLEDVKGWINLVDTYFVKKEKRR